MSDLTLVQSRTVNVADLGNALARLDCRASRSLCAGEPLQVEHVTRDNWPPAVSDGVALTCTDCGEVSLFDYGVSDAFWREWVPGPEHLGVVCLPCLDRRCAGVGLAEALEHVQWTGTGHTVVMQPVARYEYEVRDVAIPA